MLEKIKELTAQMRANIEHRAPLADVLEGIGREVDDIKARIEGLGHEATGETGAAVAALGSRLDSLTSAVSSLGSTVGLLVTRVSVLEEKDDAALRVYSSIASRVGTLENELVKAIAPAPQLVAPYPDMANGQQGGQTSGTGEQV